MTDRELFARVEECGRTVAAFDDAVRGLAGYGATEHALASRLRRVFRVGSRDRQPDPSPRPGGPPSAPAARGAA